MGATPAEREQHFEAAGRQWDGEMDVSHDAPGADAALRAQIATLFRRSASPGAALALLRMNTEIDIRAALPAVRVPTLVLHRTGDLDARIDEARWIAARLPGARLVELPGADHLPWVGDADAIVDEAEEFLTGSRRGPEADRVLATILFTDIVESTATAAALGDRAWRDLQETHHATVRRELERSRDRESDTTGDGFLPPVRRPATDAYPLGLTQDSDQARHALDDGRSPRISGQGFPEAKRPLRVTWAPRAGKNVLNTPMGRPPAPGAMVRMNGSTKSYQVMTISSLADMIRSVAADRGSPSRSNSASMTGVDGSPHAG